MADDSNDDKTPLDSALELFVFAPLGLALTARDNLPDLVAKGRQTFEGQVNLARMMGQFAVKEGTKEGRRRWAEVSETLSALGLLPNAERPEPPKAAETPPPPAATAPAPPADAAFGHERAPERANLAESKNGKAAKPSEPRPSSEGLAIHGYDSLSASQVVQRLAGLASEELEAVRAYEAATRGRRTILSKIGQLQSGPAAS